MPGTNTVKNHAPSSSAGGEEISSSGQYSSISCTTSANRISCSANDNGQSFLINVANGSNGAGTSKPPEDVSAFQSSNLTKTLPQATYTESIILSESALAPEFSNPSVQSDMTVQSNGAGHCSTESNQRTFQQQQSCANVNSSPSFSNTVDAINNTAVCSKSSNHYSDELTSKHHEANGTTHSTFSTSDSCQTSSDSCHPSSISELSDTSCTAALAEDCSSTNGSSHFSYDASDLDSVIGACASISNSDENHSKPGALPNPTLWIGDDQMLLLAGATSAEMTEDTNSTNSESKSFEGLLSPNGTSILWDENTDWILLFDNMIRYADRKQTRTTRSCGCKGHGRTEDDTDSRSQTLTKAAAKRASSAPPVRRGVFAPSKSVPSASTPKRKPSLKSTSKPSSSAGAAGAADEEMFMKAFEDVVKVTIYSTKELETELVKIKESLDPSNDWEKRVESLKRVRSIIIADGFHYPEFYHHLRSLEVPFQNSVKDLRSQVVREACIGIAYLSQRLGSKLDHFAESVLPSLINLIPNSAKIMSSAAVVAIRFIIRYTHSSRLIPTLTNPLSSKSKDIRKTCFEFLDQLLITWPTHTLEKHVSLLHDAIKKGISDADPEARAFSRKAFWSFADHFREQADYLLNSLDNSKQRMLQDELTMSNSSSSSSLTQSSKPFRQPTYSHGGSVENLSYRTGTLGRRSGIPMPASSKPEPASGIPKQLRSTSAIDLGAVRRAKARHYSSAAGLIRGSGASLPRNSIRRVDSSVNAITSPERVIKGRNKGSQSQPSSRPDSPSSRLSYATYSSTDGTPPGRVRRKSGIPTATSREASPTRTAYASHERRLSGSRTRLIGAGEKYSPISSTAVPLMAERTLQQSREAEVAVADALRAPARRRYNAFEDQSDESETSSVCSDRSFSSYGRGVEDISEVIHNLNSIHWTDRKEGLQALHAYFRSARMLSTMDLKKVTDIFTKIFMDPHTKVFTLFLDTLNELILIHKQDLHGWLYVLLTRLFLKMGADILGSVLAKIQRTLDLVRDSFPYESQFNAIMRFLNDQTQTPNTKVKVALLKYLSSLIVEMDMSKFSSANTETRFALMKIISWTAMPKSSDLKKFCEEVLVGLFQLNPAEFSNTLDQLPKTYKDSVYRFLHSKYPRSGSDSSPSSLTGTPPCPVMSHLQSPNLGLPWSRSHGSTPQNRSFEYEDTENLNPEELSNLLKKTVSEITEYDPEYYEKGNEKIISQSPSRDSGISPNMAVDGRLDTLMDRLDLGSSTDSSPTKRSPTDYTTTHFSPNDSYMFDRRLSGDGVCDDDNEIDDHKTIFLIIDELNQNTRNEKKVQALSRLIRLTREQSSIISNEDFKIILRVVIQTVEDPNVSVRSRALKALCELIKYKPDNFQEYLELTLLRILEAHKDTENDILLIADSCSAVAAQHLPLDQCVKILIPLISTGQLPVNQAAIKMLSKLVEHHSKSTVLQLLPEIMPALIKAYDHNESPVRKAAVFCMVAIHGVVGDAMKSHLTSLNGSKMKLLNVYIKKSQIQNSCGSTPGSPGNPPSTASSQ